ncbi:hypothetical protein IJF86_03250, partial [Candidatus Saccharibacteria bacterium]|nr:hypothetical protein [Candidatus Saccharibacteria bacterium]
ANPLGRKYVFSQRANPLKQNFFAKPKAGFSSPASSSRKSKLFLILLLGGKSSRRKVSWANHLNMNKILIFYLEANPLGRK